MERCPDPTKEKVREGKPKAGKKRRARMMHALPPWCRPALGHCMGDPLMYIGGYRNLVILSQDRQTG